MGPLIAKVILGAIFLLWFVFSGPDGYSIKERVTLNGLSVAFALGVCWLASVALS